MPYHNIFKKILFYTNFSDHDEKAFFYALNIARGNPESELLIYHVIPEPDAQFWKSYIYEVEEIDDKAKHDIDLKIEEVYAKHIPKGLKWSTKFEIGHPDQKILETAKNEETDLVILGRQGKSSFGSRLLGDFTEHIARKSPCPIMIIPEKHADSDLSEF